MTSAVSLFESAPSIVSMAGREIKGQTFTLPALCRMLQNVFDGYYSPSQIRFVPQYNFIDDDVISIGGEYNCSEDVPMIIFIQGKNRSKRYHMNDEKWASISFLIAVTARHESIHEYQYAVMKNHPERARYKTDLRNYFDSCVEIDAFGHDIAMELYFVHGYQKALKMLRSPKKIRGSQTFNLYRAAFRRTDWYQTRRPLLKKVYRWLEVIDRQFNLI